MFTLTFVHKYSMNDIEQMFPFERDIYSDLAYEHLKKQEEEYARQARR